MPVGTHTRRLTINLPSDVAEDLASRAAADGRSLSAYIVRLLCRPSPAAADDPLPLAPPLSTDPEYAAWLRAHPEHS